jgi:hypothetical protein
LLQVAPRFLHVPPFIQPRQLLQTIVISLARQGVQRVPQEMHIASLPPPPRQRFPNRGFQSRTVVTDDKLHPCLTAFLKSQQKLLPTALALPLRILYRQHLPPPFQSISKANNMARSQIILPSRTRSSRAYKITYGNASLKGRRLNPSSWVSNRAVIALILEALNSCPHNSSVITAIVGIFFSNQYADRYFAAAKNARLQSLGRRFRDAGNNPVDGLLESI